MHFIVIFIAYIIYPTLRIIYQTLHVNVIHHILDYELYMAWNLQDRPIPK